MWRSSNRHILSDKTGTITANNLQVASISTRQAEYSLMYTHLTAPAEEDQSIHSLLLNMVTNHSALSISHPNSMDLVEFADSISYAQSQSVSRSSYSGSFSEIHVNSIPDQIAISSISVEKEGGDVQVFCSSQDERVSFSFQIKL